LRGDFRGRSATTRRRLNSFSIPVSQLVEDPRVLRGAEIKNFDEAPFARKSGAFERLRSEAGKPTAIQEIWKSENA